MNDWTVFTWLFDSFNAPFLAAVNTQSTQLAQAVATPAMLAATIYIGVIFSIDLYTGNGGNPVLDLARRAGRVALILACLGAGVYTGTIANLLLTTLPNELSRAVAGGAAVGAGAFDHLGGQMYVSVVQVWSHINAWSPKTLVPAIFACLYVGYASAAIALCFSLWLITQIALGLTVAIGPLAIACLINPQTARFFNGWLATIVTFIIAQVMLVTTVSVLLTTVNNTLAKILADNAPTGDNADAIGGQIHQMVNAGLMFTVAAIVSLSVVPIARAIGGGAAAELAAVSRWASNKVSAGHAVAGNAAVKGAGAAGNAAVSGAGAAGNAAVSGGAAAMRSIAPAARAVGGAAISGGAAAMRATAAAAPAAGRLLGRVSG